MKYRMSDGTIANEITQDNNRDYVEVILSRKEFLELGNFMAREMAKYAYKPDTIEDL